MREDRVGKNAEGDGEGTEGSCVCERFGSVCVKPQAADGARSLFCLCHRSSTVSGH